MPAKGQKWCATCRPHAKRMSSSKSGQYNRRFFKKVSKQCPKCRRFFPIAAFIRPGNRKSRSLGAYCKPCRNKNEREKRVLTIKKFECLYCGKPGLTNNIKHPNPKKYCSRDCCRRYCQKQKIKLKPIYCYECGHYIEIGKRKKRCDVCNKKRAGIRSRLWHYNNKATASKITLRQLNNTISIFDEKCCYCGEKWEHIDHLIPRSKGGTHVKENVVPSCSICNLKKGSMLPYEFCGIQKYAEIIVKLATND